MAGATVLLYRLGAGVARAVPASVAYGASTVLGAVAARVVPARRRQVERNLRRIHGPGFGGRPLAREVRQTFASYARYWVESFRLPGTSPEQLAEGFTVEGWDEHLLPGLEAGRGVILAMPHLGGWEWAGFWTAAAMKKPMSVVVEAVDPPELFKWFVDLRQAFGLTVIPLGPTAGADVVRALKDNHIVALLSDRSIDGTGPAVEFFGERTALPAGPATLALRMGSPILPTAVYFTGAKRHGVIGAPLPVERTGKLRDDVARLTQAVATALEDLIRRAPQQWHLMQPNWPSDPGYRGGRDTIK